MNPHHDLERRLADYYDAEAPRQAPDRVLHAALTSIETTRQRRVLIPALRRFHDMNASAKALVAAAAIVVGVLALAVFGPFRPGSNGPGVGAAGSPSPSPAASSAQPSSSPSASAARPSPSALALTESFTSAVFGVSTSYPAGWHVAPATKLWTTGIPWNCGQPDPCPFDQIWEKPDDSQLYHLASQPLGGKSGAEWGSAILADPGWEATCAKTTEPISIDGTPGTMAKICGQSLFVAVTSKGGRGYAFVLYRSDDVNAFKQLLATVRLHPEAAASEMPSAGPS